MKFQFTVIVVTIFKLCDTVTSNPLLVQTLNGQVHGITLQSSTNKYINAWYGIPFAKPPIGDLRFQPPVEALPWNGILETTTQPNSCLQEATFAEGSPLSEDCLYLNVVAPRNFNGRLKVMVWIYGGGYFAGSSSLASYDLKNFVAEENVIMVSFQYRVNSLGFLYLGTPEAPGNAGLFDQVLAMKWVKENIESFGGDPDDITLFGESAGASSVAFHLLSPLSKNLFKRAILESGAATCPWALSSQSESIDSVLILAERVNCPHDRTNLPATLDCLKSVDGQLLIINKQWNVPLGLGDTLFFPVVDGNFLTDTPENLLSLNKFKDKNILIGHNNNEAALFFILTMSSYVPDMTTAFVTKSIMQQATNSLLGNKFNQDAIDAIIREYTKSLSPGPTTNYRDAFVKLGSDYYFSCHSNKMAQEFSEDKDIDVYAYLFSYRTINPFYPPWVKATHGDELAYVFGQALNSAYGHTEDEKNLSRKMMRYWSNFAKTGDPNGDNLAEWPKYKSGGNSHVLEFNLNDFVVKKDTDTKDCKIWNKYQ